MTTKRTLLAVDGNSLVHRSYHAMVGSNLRTTAGFPTWALKGFLAQMLEAVDRVGASGLVVGFDHAGNSSRKQKWPHYKATRSEKPEDLVKQLTMAPRMLHHAGVHVVVPSGLEADDVLASAAASADRAGWNTVILTSDRDAFALVSDTTSVLRLVNGGVAGSPLLTPESMFEHYGVHGHQYRDYAAMRGDTSDNLAGIRGIGEKTGAKLLAEFGTVDAALQDAATGGARVAATLGKAMVTKLTSAENIEAFRQNVEIMTMRTDLDLGLQLDDGSPTAAGCLPIPQGPLAEAIDRLELASVRKRALYLLAGVGTAPAVRERIPDADDEPFDPELAEMYAPATTASAAASAASAPGVPGVPGVPDAPAGIGGTPTRRPVSLPGLAPASFPGSTHPAPVDWDELLLAPTR